MFSALTSSLQWYAAISNVVPLDFHSSRTRSLTPTYLHTPEHFSLSVWAVSTLQSFCRQWAKQGLQSWAVMCEMKTLRTRFTSDFIPRNRGEITLRVMYTSSTTSDKTGLNDKLKHRFVDYWMWSCAHQSLCVSVTRNFGPPPTFSSWTWRSVTSLWQSHSHPFSSWTPFTRGGFLVKQVFYSHETIQKA